MVISRSRCAACFLLFAALGAYVALPACHTRDADEGSIRVSAGQVVGVYSASLKNGTERLVLNSNGTYLQEFTSKSQPVEHTGRWRVENELLDGSVVILADAVLTEDEASQPAKTGELRLYAHQRSGKVALARNEVAAWYYERTK